MKTARGNRLIVLLMVLALSGCASQPKNQIILMPAPDVFGQGEWDPFTARDPVKDIPYGGILYATDREPARKEGQYYRDDRGHVLRLGVARVTVGKEGMTWDEARRISMLKNRPEDYPLKVTAVQEIGILDRSINVLTDSLAEKGPRQLPGEQFAAKVNAKLAISQVKDVFIFGSYLVDGILAVVESLTVYASTKDKALGVSQWVFGRERLGQIVSKDLTEDAAGYLRRNSKLVIVNATDTPGADTGNGHAYFRQSPSTSSDILATLMFGLKPEERGLEQTGGRPIWTFSADYIDKLRAALEKVRSK